MIEEWDEKAISISRDERGSVIYFGRFSLEGLHVVEMKAGAVRGNHIHDKDEIMCIIGGSGVCEITVEDKTSQNKEKILVKGDMKAYRIKAGIRHVVTNIGNDRFYLVCFYSS